MNHFSKLVAIAVALSCSAVTRGVSAEFSFTHPGLLHSREDLVRMSAAIAAKEEPVVAGFDKFRVHSASRATYVMRGPGEEIGRAPTVNHGEFDSDANAAYQNALMWCLTGERVHAEKAKQIVDAWSATLKRVSGADAVLMAGLGPFKLINAAELLRHTDAGWPDADARRCERMLREAIYPALKDFAPFANGNWDTAAIKTMLALGVFCDDRAIFERALRYYIDGHGDGRLTHYIINDAGQCQESGRDMPHTQLGLAHLGDACEIAWHQGLDLYGHAQNRLLAGFEYTARYNLGEDVPFTETLDRTGKYHHTRIATQGRGQLRPVYEQIYHHFVNRAGLAAPWTQRAAEKLRPEGEGRPGADHPGFGTLLYTRPRATDAATKLVAPAAVVARGSPTGVALSWIAVRGATGYTIKRATTPANVFSVLGRDVPATTFTDPNVTSGTLYTYLVTAANAAGESPASFATTIAAGLPAQWKSADIGAPSAAGSTSFNGRTFTLEAAGTGLAGSADQLHFVHQPLAGDGMIIARFVPQVSSQFSEFGVMVRGSPAPDAPTVAVLLAPVATEDRERPRWRSALLVRTAPGLAVQTVSASEPLPAPIVTYGRLMQSCWLRLERRADTFTASFSTDGQVWTTVGTVSARLPRDALIGLAACSRLAELTTTVAFDRVEVGAATPSRP